MTGLDVSRLSPGDATVALRSYSRRYRAAFASMPGDPDSLDALALRLGPSGPSGFDLLIDTVRTLGITGHAFGQIVYGRDPNLHAAVIDPSERHWEAPAVGSIADTLDELDHELTQLADAASKVRGDDWVRTGTIAGTDRSVTATDVLREAVRTAAENLRQIEATLAAVRSRS